VTLSALTFNVLYEGLEDVAVEWLDRVADVAGLIRYHEPTLVGLQECWLGQTDDIRELLPEYEWFGEDRDIGEHTPIGVHRDRAAIVDKETFWLAPDRTDRRPAWDATLPRLATHVTVEVASTDRPSTTTTSISTSTASAPARRARRFSGTASPNTTGR